MISLTLTPLFGNENCSPHHEPLRSPSVSTDNLLNNSPQQICSLAENFPPESTYAIRPRSFPTPGPFQDSLPDRPIHSPSIAAGNGPQQLLPSGDGRVLRVKMTRDPNYTTPVLGDFLFLFSILARLVIKCFGFNSLGEWVWLKLQCTTHYESAFKTWKHDQSPIYGAYMNTGHARVLFVQ